ncbi:NAD(+) diphosphatase [Nocardioides alcanivorans]|uniref:NAD(+) diphosphatase n=1 Tax=Nocardioides alcanivorans TaxID=2897352 RepID=UPI001F24C7E6|nr:NAD(+) diphosphatase [Nocardioides alcanivorans]
MNRELPHVALSKHPHDRHGAQRQDDSWLEKQWADPSTRVLTVAGTRIRPQDGKLVWTSPEEAIDGLRVLLGERDQTTYFASIIDPSEAPGAREEWLMLRAALGVLDPGQAPMVMHAIGLAEWHWATRFCPRCAGTLASRMAGHVLACEACGKEQYPRTDPAVIMLITDGEPGSREERCLLGRNGAWPEGRYSTLAGFLEPGERLEDAVRREVWEETGVVVGEVGYFDSQPWPLPASLMLGFFGRAIESTINVDGSEIADAIWLTRGQMQDRAASGELVLPGGVSISRSLIEEWYGGELPGAW